MLRVTQASRQSPAVPQTPLTDIPNIGPASAAAFQRAGIAWAEDLRAIGADAAYQLLLESGERPHFIAYYVLVMGLQGRPWNDARGPEKEALRAAFDAIKARVTPVQKGRPGIEAALDALGVVPRKGQPTSSSPEKK